MHLYRYSAPNGRQGNWHSLLLSLALISLTACAPERRLPNIVSWPNEWDGRSLWVTPHAYIYASSGAAAGEVDRLAARVKREYSAELDQPTPPVLIIVHDAGESYPGDDVRALLRDTLRSAILRDAGPSSVDPPPELPEQSLSQRVDEAYTGLLGAAVATGTTLDTLAGMTPLTCGAQGLRQICGAPDGLADQKGGAVILPTRACLHAHVRRVMQNALKLYGISPAAQMIFAPVLAVAEAKTVERLDQLRDTALFNHWLFVHADLPIEKKREIAADRLEDWGEGVEAAAASIVGMTN